VKQEKTSQKSPLSIPAKWQERFLIKRIKEEDIEVSLEERNAILEELNGGRQFVQIGKYTLMLNSIKSIDPLWEPDNIPPCPKKHLVGSLDEKREVYVQEEEKTSKEDRELWFKLFGKKQLLKHL